MGVTEDLLDHADVDSLLDEKGRRGVPGVVDSGVSYAGLLEDGIPLLPVFRTLDRAAELRCEDQIVIRSLLSIPQPSSVRRPEASCGLAVGPGAREGIGG
jgi:hypothetical protein